MIHEFISRDNTRVRVLKKTELNEYKIVLVIGNRLLYFVCVFYDSVTFKRRKSSATFHATLKPHENTFVLITWPQLPECNAEEIGFWRNKLIFLVILWLHFLSSLYMHYCLFILIYYNAGPSKQVFKRTRTMQKQSKDIYKRIIIRNTRK